MSVRVADLLPGDQVALAGRTAVHITHTAHPYWPHLQLVIWRMDDGTFSFDALSNLQDVGDRTPATWEARRARLLEAITPRQGARP